MKKVRSQSHGTVGYLHHIGDRGKAWVSDSKDGSSGQFFYLDDLIPYVNYEDSIDGKLTYQENQEVGARVTERHESDAPE